MASKRLDLLLVERGLYTSREQAQASILAGEVWTTKGQRLEKSGDKVSEETEIEIRSRTPAFASRAGHKLKHALDEFQITPQGKTCMDIGASTGGFTDCLLKAGAKHVFAVDVGYGQIDIHLRNHPDVSVLEKTNARYLTKEQIGKPIQLIVMDVSFISLRKIIEPLAKEFPECTDWVFLFKPQFEVGRQHIGKGGLVKSEEAVKTALSEFNLWIQSLGFKQKEEPKSSPLTGKKSGNLEYLLHYELKS